jgi:hypothetical protein
MGDHTTERFQQLQLCRHDNERYVRERLLRRRGLDLHKDKISWIVNHIDCFVNQSQGNKSVETLTLYPYSVDDENYDVWDKVGQAIGNLQSLHSS